MEISLEKDIGRVNPSLERSGGKEYSSKDLDKLSSTVMYNSGPMPIQPAPFGATPMMGNSPMPSGPVSVDVSSMIGGITDSPNDIPMTEQVSAYEDIRGTGGGCSVVKGQTPYGVDPTINNNPVAGGSGDPDFSSMIGGITDSQNNIPMTEQVSSYNNLFGSTYGGSAPKPEGPTPFGISPTGSSTINDNSLSSGPASTDLSSTIGKMTDTPNIPINQQVSAHNELFGSTYGGSAPKPEELTPFGIPKESKLDSCLSSGPANVGISSRIDKMTDTLNIPISQQVSAHDDLLRSNIGGRSSGLSKDDLDYFDFNKPDLPSVGGSAPSARESKAIYSTPSSFIPDYTSSVSTPEPDFLKSQSKPIPDLGQPELRSPYLNTRQDESRPSGLFSSVDSLGEPDAKRYSLDNYVSNHYVPDNKNLVPNLGDGKSGLSEEDMSFFDFNRRDLTGLLGSKDSDSRKGDNLDRTFSCLDTRPGETLKETRSTSNLLNVLNSLDSEKDSDRAGNYLSSNIPDYTKTGMNLGIRSNEDSDPLSSFMKIHNNPSFLSEEDSEEDSDRSIDYLINKTPDYTKKGKNLGIGSNEDSDFSSIDRMPNFSNTMSSEESLGSNVGNLNAGTKDSLYKQLVGMEHEEIKPRYQNFDIGSEKVTSSEKKGMSFIDLPGMDMQAHSHEGDAGTAHFKRHTLPPSHIEKNPKYRIPMLTSYEFAMGDLYARNMGLRNWRDSARD